MTTIAMLGIGLALSLFLKYDHLKEMVPHAVPALPKNARFVSKFEVGRLVLKYVATEHVERIQIGSITQRTAESAQNDDNAPITGEEWSQLAYSVPLLFLLLGLPSAPNVDDSKCLDEIESMERV